ncbi:carboxylesterase [Massilia forsythiae]|uniref:Carboxylesterase n=1 Tax=Massilia forsythiae TaxID=2728020 RepID=A0A7Z2VWQ1_9BURK|nr:carboxylesterase [Massilia forsythiae]QJE00528.1 carboxylesterase [Massilia forsythiae]
MSELLEHVQVDTADDPQVSVIWLHGLGADGNDFVPMVRELDLSGLPGIRFIFPHARTIPVTVNNGYVMRAWYDITGAELVRREDENGLRASQLEVEAFIAREKARGIPASRIVLAGFSQGCAMTIQAGLRHPEPLAGMICLSGYVPLSAKLPAERTDAALATPIFMAHGRHDNVVPFNRATMSRDLLVSMGCRVEWHEYTMAHSVCMEEVQDLSAFFRKVIG